MKIQNAVALVTGANRGIGRAFATELVRRGAKVYAAAREPSSVDVDGAIAVRLDVTRGETIAALAKELGDVTLLVNNAGIVRAGGLAQADVVARAREELETNVLGPLATSQAFAATLAKNGGGAIVNVLSALSWATLPGSATYSASKAAAWAITNGLRNELRGQGTRVVGVHVGFVDTELVRAVTAPKVRPETVVERTLDALERGDEEVLVDEVSRALKAGLSSGVYLGQVSGS